MGPSIGLVSQTVPGLPPAVDYSLLQRFVVNPKPNPEADLLFGGLDQGVFPLPYFNSQGRAGAVARARGTASPGKNAPDPVNLRRGEPLGNMAEANGRPCPCFNNINEGPVSLDKFTKFNNSPLNFT